MTGISAAVDVVKYVIGWRTMRPGCCNPGPFNLLVDKSVGLNSNFKLVSV
jgi:hypothetical protein